MRISLLLLLLVLSGACAGPLSPRSAEPRPARVAAPEPAAETQGGALLLAARALGEERPEDTLEHLSRAPDAAREEATWWLLSAMARLDLGQPARALEDLQELLVRDPDDAGTWALVARAQAELGDWEDADLALQRALELAPNEARHHASRGLLALRAQRWEDAEALFEQALQIQPELPAAHQGLARLASLRGQPGFALDALERALAQRPDDAMLLTDLGHARRDLGQPCEARDAYTRALSSTPDDGWLLANLGAAELECGEARAAREHLIQALRLLGDAPRPVADIERWLGRAEKELGRGRAAQDAYEAAWYGDRDLPGLAEEYGLLLIALGDDAHAAEALWHGFDGVALSPEGLLELCLAAERLGDLDGALRVAAELDARRAGGLRERLALARLHLESSQPAWDDAAEAQRLLQPLLRGPLRDHADSWLLLADAQRRAGQWGAALSSVDEALLLLGEDDPDAARARDERQRLLARLDEQR